MSLFNTRLTLNVDEKRTFRLHTIYMILEGVVLGVMALNEFKWNKLSAGIFIPVQYACVSISDNYQ